jgi:Holin of 3TMs, for gene-transfer release
MADEVKEVKKDEDWMQKKWRPAMGWMYMGICTLDMGIFPILWSILQASLGQPVTQWQPLTLQGAGLFHVAMGAVLGIAAFGRTQEKLAGASSNAQPAALPAPTFGTAAPTPMVKPTPMAAAPAASFGGGFGLDPSDPQTRNTRND